MEEIDKLVMFYIKLKQLETIIEQNKDKYQMRQVKRKELEEWLEDVFGKWVGIVDEYRGA